jgi:hypothetical protein
MPRQLTAPSQPTYTGAWRATTTYSDRRIALAPGVDPSHMRPDDPDPGQVAAGYPRVDLPPTYLTEDADTDYRDALDTPGLVLDTEPITHDAGDPESFQPSPGYGGIGANFAPSMIPHAIARGREMVGQHEEPQMRASDEEPRTERWENAPVSRGSTLSSLRGTNSLPENNPDGFPTGPGQYGYSVKRFYHRRMPWEEFKHTERMLRFGGAAKAVDSPAMGVLESNRYTSPFAWKSFYAGALLQAPQMRRQPPDAWADQQSDGTDQPSDTPSLWTAD